MTEFWMRTVLLTLTACRFSTGMPWSHRYLGSLAVSPIRAQLHRGRPLLQYSRPPPTPQPRKNRTSQTLHQLIFRPSQSVPPSPAPCRGKKNQRRALSTTPDACSGASARVSPGVSAERAKLVSDTSWLWERRGWWGGGSFGQGRSRRPSAAGERNQSRDDTAGSGLGVRLAWI